jgi:hypothetical protein
VLDGGLVCKGSHPNVEGSSRFCDKSDCYCTNPFDTCFPANIADQCCKEKPTCANDAGPGGVECKAELPIVGPPRTCKPGYCLCSDGDSVDACYEASVAKACCPPRIPLACVSGGPDNGGGGSGSQ